MKKDKAHPANAPARLIPHWSIVLLLFVIGFLAYHRSIFNGVFLFDDKALVLENPLIKNLSYLKTIFTTHLYHGSGTYSNFYRPIQSVSFMLDYHFWKLNPLGYHLSSVIIHILSATLVYFLIYLLYKNQGVAVITGLLFSVHTVLSWPVNYIASRADLISVFFFLLATILYVLYKEGDSSRYSVFFYLASLASFILAILSKEVAIMLPVLILSYLYCFPKTPRQPKRHAPNLLWPFFIVIGIYALLRSTVLDFTGGKILETTTGNVPLLFRLLTSSKVLMLYFRLLLVPMGLHMEWDIKPATSFFLQDEVFLSVIGLVIIGIYTYIMSRRSRLKFFAISWFFIALLPYANIYPLAYFMGEGWLYLPSIGFFTLLAIYLSELARRSRVWSFLVISTLVPIVVFYSILTIKRADVWADPIKLYAEVLRYSPDNTKARINLGVILAESGLDEEAMEKYKEAIELLDDKAGDARTQVGNIYAKKGMYDSVLDEFKRAVEIAPNDHVGHTNIGIIYKKKGDFKKAEEWYRKAIEINPNYDLVYNNLGNIYLETGRYDEAIIYYEKAIDLNPHRAPFYENLGKAYKGKREYQKAREAFEEALKLDDSLEEVRTLLESLN